MPNSITGSTNNSEMIRQNWLSNLDHVSRFRAGHVAGGNRDDVSRFQEGLTADVTSSQVGRLPKNALINRAPVATLTAGADNIFRLPSEARTDQGGNQTAVNDTSFASRLPPDSLMARAFSQ